MMSPSVLNSLLQVSTVQISSFLALSMRPPSSPYLHQLFHMPTQGGPVGLGCHARGPLHHQRCFEGGRWLGQGQRGTVSQGTDLGWWSEFRGQVSPDSWDSGAPGCKKAHRSRPPCRRDPGKAGGGQGVTDPLFPSIYQQPTPFLDPHFPPVPKDPLLWEPLGSSLPLRHIHSSYHLSPSPDVPFSHQGFFFFFFDPI